jgi:hypothetical protein
MVDFFPKKFSVTKIGLWIILLQYKETRIFSTLPEKYYLESNSFEDKERIRSDVFGSARRVRSVFEITQNLAGCWGAGWPRPKIWLGARWLAGPGLKFSWVLGCWVAQPKNFAGCWGAGWPSPKISLGAG